jgi:hypothetical protein
MGFSGKKSKSQARFSIAVSVPCKFLQVGAHAPGAICRTSTALDRREVEAVEAIDRERTDLPRVVAEAA